MAPTATVNVDPLGAWGAVGAAAAALDTAAATVGTAVEAAAATLGTAVDTAAATLGTAVDTAAATLGTAVNTAAAVGAAPVGDTGTEPGAHAATSTTPNQADASQRIDLLQKRRTLALTSTGFAAGGEKSKSNLLSGQAQARLPEASSLWRTLSAASWPPKRVGQR
ncbi:MAG: hypothetical protein LC797_14265 [Chloroflexi bacterium]|nr:hypothetical protein [Chloroflexota bacterium]